MIPQQFAIVDGGEGVVIGDEIISITFMLELQSSFHHAKVIADVETPTGLETGKNTHSPQSWRKASLRSSEKRREHQDDCFTAGFVLESLYSFCV